MGILFIGNKDYGDGRLFSHVNANEAPSTMSRYFTMSKNL
jgi:hypothetical protein